MSPLVFLTSSRKHISHSCKSCESFVERMSVDTCSSLYSILVTIASPCFKCLHHPTVAGSRVLANRTLAVHLYFVRTRLFSKSAVMLASTSGTLFGTNASHPCLRLKVVVLVIAMVFFLIRHHAGKTRG